MTHAQGTFSIRIGGRHEMIIRMWSVRSQDLASAMQAFINKALHCLLYCTVIINYLKTIYYEPVT